MLSLNHTDVATEDDISNNLVYWASIFKATTWEEFKVLANGDPTMEEVGDLILELNTDNQAKELLEGQRRYREMMATQYSAGYIDAEENYKSIIADKDATIAEISASNAEKDAKLKADAETISKLEAELSRLRSRSDK